MTLLPMNFMGFACFVVYPSLLTTLYIHRDVCNENKYSANINEDED